LRSQFSWRAWALAVLLLACQAPQLGAVPTQTVAPRTTPTVAREAYVFGLDPFAASPEELPQLMGTVDPRHHKA